MELIEKVAVVTCVCTELGHAAARRLCKSGASVYINDADESHGSEIAKELGAIGVNYIQHSAIFRMDLSGDSKDRILSADFLEENERVDILVNIVGCAQIASKEKSPDDFIQANMARLNNLNSAFIPFMNTRDGAKIINVSSDMSLEKELVASTKNLAVELADQRINVNCLCTEKTSSDQIQNEIAEIIWFLASSASNHITGQSLHMSGILAT
jgi:NAD(P)-dependent dehydrogenase (short-subunit alcohol dehydrogenase family)